MTAAANNFLCTDQDFFAIQQPYLNPFITLNIKALPFFFPNLEVLITPTPIFFYRTVGSLDMKHLSIS